VQETDDIPIYSISPRLKKAYYYLEEII
jgi:hypothetical protein